MGIAEVQYGEPLRIGMVPFQEEGFYRIALKELNGIQIGVNPRVSGGADLCNGAIG